MNKIRLFIVDDHELVREGLKFFLSGIPFVEVIGSAATPGEALHLIPRCSPHIVTIDLGLPSIETGFCLIADIKLQYPRVKTMALTAHESHEALYGALAAGATGYVLKSTSIPDLSTAIDSVHKGKVYISPNMLHHVVEGYINPTDKNFYNKNLSQREREVLCLISDGKSNKQIGEILFISARTVEKHKSSLKKKLQCNNSIELATYFLKNSKK